MEGVYQDARDNQEGTKRMRIGRIVGLVCAFASVYWMGIIRGKQKARSQIPSCLYLQRPSINDVKPLGYDNKEGIDWHCDGIIGGGIFVSLEKWKK